jgi:hypothetical protein
MHKYFPEILFVPFVPFCGKLHFVQPGSKWSSLTVVI